MPLTSTSPRAMSHTRPISTGNTLACPADRWSNTGQMSPQDCGDVSKADKKGRAIRSKSFPTLPTALLGLEGWVFHCYPSRKKTTKKKKRFEKIICVHLRNLRLKTPHSSEISEMELRRECLSFLLQTITNAQIPNQIHYADSFRIFLFPNTTTSLLAEYAFR